MSQKPPHNSKRRPPGEAPPSDQQDADWGFDSGESDPAVEKKLAVALVVCLLAGFGFVFYQKFRILRNGEGTGSEASTLQVAAQAADEEDSSAADASLEPGATAGDSTSSTPPGGTESPFYEASAAGKAAKRPVEESWTLTQAEVSAAPTSTPPAELPPLPSTPPDAGFDPFGTAEPAGAAASTPAAATPPASEAPTFVWEEPPAPAAAPQSQQPALPEMAQSGDTTQAPAEDLFDLDPAEGTAAAGTDTDTPGNDGPEVMDLAEEQLPAASGSPPPQAEPPMLILEEELQGSPHSSEEMATATTEPLPAQTERSPFGEAGNAQPAAGEASGFDPFAGDATAKPGGEAEEAPPTVSAPSDSFDPFGAAEPTAAAPGEPSMETAPHTDASPESAGNPFVFGSRAAAGPSGTGTTASEPALDRPAEATPSAAAPPRAAPVWPGGEPLPAPAPRQIPAPFPGDEPREASGPAPRLLVEPQQLDPQPAVIPPAPDFPPAGQEPTPPNPFSIDSGSSRPLSSSVHGAQRVVGEREITVTPSDSFWSISEREYGSSRYFTALSRYNQDRVAKPEQLQSGMKIVIPPPEVLEDRFPELLRRPASGTPTIAPMSGSSASLPTGLFLDDADRPMYRVGERDTLSTIAQTHLGRSSRWTEIYDLNRDRLKSPSTLAIGMELRLPPDASGVLVSPAGGFDR